MSFEFLPSLIVLTMVLSVLFRLALARRLRRELLWTAKSLALAGLAAWSIFSESLFWQNVNLAVFAFLILLPTLVRILFSRLNLKGRYEAALRVARFYGLLHPAESSRTLVSQLEILHRAVTSDEEELPAPPADPADERTVARYLTQLTIGNRWQEICEWTGRAQTAASGKAMSATLASFRVRALGESGRYPELCEFYLAGIKVDIGSSYLIQMMIAAFLGDEALVGQITSGPLAVFEKDRKRYWQALAGRFDDNTSYRATMTQLASAPSPVMRRAAKGRLSQQLDERPVGQQVGQVLNDIRTVLSVRRVTAGKKKPVLTWAFAAVLLVVWVLQELLGGSTDPKVLERLGAVNGYAVMAGEYWRMLTANFLHYGTLHLVLNVGCLLAIGPIAEDFVGRRRYALLLVLLVCCGVSTVVGMSIAGLIPVQTLVGASSVIMGLVGFELASSLRVWRQTGHKEAKSRFALWLLIVALQTVMDYFVVQISLLAHLSGVIWGVLFALLFGRRRT